MSDCAPTKLHLTFCQDKINFHHFYCPFMSLLTDKQGTLVNFLNPFLGKVK